MPQPKTGPQPYRQGRLRLDHGHVMYFAEYGNPNGMPAVRLHGGPGSGSKPSHTEIFNLKTQRVILFDQRGCGKSAPQGEIRHNTIQHLVGDMETLRKYLGIQRWLVVGTSWGSTLALAYAEKHPQRVTGLVVSAIFMGTAEEVDWLANPQGVARFFPTEYAAAKELFPHTSPTKIPAAILKILTGKNKARAREVARRWRRLDALTASLTPDRKALEKEIRTSGDIVRKSMVFWHYTANHFFLKPGQLLKQVGKIARIPTHISQANYDMCTPPAAAYALHQALPKAKFVTVHLCGHQATPEMNRVRKAAVTAFAKLK